MRKALLALVVLSSAAGAGDFPRTALLGLGFPEVRAGDLPATRSTLPAGFAVSGDFNRDGRPDEARLLVRPESGEGRLVATILTDRLDTFVLASFPLAELPQWRIAPAGSKGDAIRVQRGDGQVEVVAYRSGPDGGDFFPLTTAP